MLGDENKVSIKGHWIIFCLPNRIYLRLWCCESNFSSAVVPMWNLTPRCEASHWAQMTVEKTSTIIYKSFRFRPQTTRNRQIYLRHFIIALPRSLLSIYLFGAWRWKILRNVIIWKTFSLPQHFHFFVGDDEEAFAIHVEVTYHNHHLTSSRDIPEKYFSIFHSRRTSFNSFFLPVCLQIDSPKNICSKREDKLVEWSFHHFISFGKCGQVLRYY